MLDTETRQIKNRLLNPLLPIASRLTPIQLSAVGLIVAVICGVFLARGHYAIGFILWWVNRAFDGIDGIVARETGQQTDLGGYIDIMFDFAAYGIVPFALVWANSETANWMALAFLYGTFYINTASWMYLSAILEKRNQGASARGETTSVSIPGGLVGGFLTIVFFCLFILLPQFLQPLFWVMGVLVLVGVIQRLVWANNSL